jgi:ribosome-associated protein
MDPFAELEDQERPSKSARKRDMHRLQALGVELLSLRPSAWARLPLSEALRVALRETQAITSHGARRRQLQFLGRLMRDEDGDAIAQALARLRAGKPIAAPSDGEEE